MAASDWGVAQGDIDRRLLRYQQAPQPEKNFGKPRAKFRCNWKIGDTFAYQLPTDVSVGEYAGKYFLLRKVADTEFGDGSLYPIVSISLWESYSLPRTTAEFCSVPLLRLNRKRMYLPPGHYEDRCELIIKSNRHLERTPLIYLGCFADVSTPEDEGIIDDPGKMTLLLLDYLDRDLPLFVKRSRFYEEVRKANSN